MRGSLCVVSVVGVVVGCGAVRKPPDPNRRLEIQQTGAVFESNNGYRFAALPERMAKVIRVDVRYPVGSVDDPPGKAGLAHLVEHLLFDVEFSQGGTKTSIGAELGHVALSWNAETTADFTTYQTVAAPDQLSKVLALEVNRIALGCAGLTPAIVAREREVVLNELRTRQGASGAQLSRILHEAVYPEGHPYRAVDSVETVEKLELADVCQFIAANYQRGEAVVVVSGDVEAGSLQVAAGKEFVRLRKRVRSTRPAIPLVDGGGTTIRTRADVDDPLFVATWSLPPMDTREYRLLEMASRAIDERLEGFAFTYKWGHSSFSQLLGGARAPVLAVGIHLNSAASLDDAIDAAKRSVQFSLRALGTEKETVQWQNQWQMRAEVLLAAWESLASRNELFANILSSEHSDDYLVGRVAEVMKSSPGEIRALGEKWLSPGRTRYVLVEPTGAASAVAGSSFTGGSEAIATAVDGSLADNPLPTPPPQPGISAERYTLDNGLRVVLWPYGRTPLIRARLVIDSGSAHDPVGDEGIADLIGASRVGPDSLIFEARDLSISVDRTVASLAGELVYPGYGLSDEEKAYLKARLAEPSAKQRRAYEKDLLVAVYGKGHPYARSDISEESLAKLHTDLVNDWARSHVVPKNATLVIAGEFDANLVKQHIAYRAAHLSGGSNSADIKVDVAPSVPHIVTGMTPKPSPTIELDVLFRTDPDLDRNHAKRLILEELLDGELSVLRSKHAVTYGFSASYEPRKAGGLWRISGEADASRGPEATRVLLDLLDTMRKDPESYRGSFVLARQKVLERLLVSSTDSLTMAERLVTIAKFDLPEDFYDRLPNQVAAVTLADMNKFLVEELPATGQTVGVFGHESAVEAAAAVAGERLR